MEEENITEKINQLTDLTSELHSTIIKKMPNIKSLGIIYDEHEEKDSVVSYYNISDINGIDDETRFNKIWRDANSIFTILKSLYNNEEYFKEDCKTFFKMITDKEEKEEQTTPKCNLNINELFNEFKDEL